VDKNEKEKILHELSGISSESYDQLLSMFIPQAKDKIVQIEKYAQKKEFEKIADLAHTIKGTAANLRLQSVKMAALEVELTAKRHENVMACLKILSEQILSL